MPGPENPSLASVAPSLPRIVVAPPFFPVYANDPKKAPNWSEWANPNFTDPRLIDPTPPDGIGRVVRALLSCSHEETHLLAHKDSYTNHPHVTIHSITDLSFGTTTHEQQIQAAKARTLELTKNLIRQTGAQDVNLHWTQADVARELAKLLQPVNGRLIVSLHNTPDIESRQIIELAKLNPTTRVTVLSEAHRQGFQDQLKNHEDLLTIVGSGLEMGRLYPHNDFLPLSTTKDTPPHPILEALKFLGLDYLLIIGSLGPHKGQKSARAIASGAGIPLVELGGLGAPNPHRGAEVDIQYAQGLRSMTGFIDCAHGNVRRIISEIQLTRSRGQVPFLGGLEVDEYIKQAFSRFALGALCTSGMEYEYTEAYNLAAAEPPANGTHTLAIIGSSVAERLIPGTGFIFTDIPDAIQKVRELPGQSRKLCAETASCLYDIHRAGSALTDLNLAPRLSSEKLHLLIQRSG